MLKPWSILEIIAILFLVSCRENDEVLQANKEEGTLSISVVIDQEVGVTNARNETISTDSFSVFLMQDSGDTLVIFDQLIEVPEKLILPVGEYYVVVSSNAEASAGFESPFYWGKSSAFSVNPGQETPVSVTCALANTMVTIKYSAHVQEYFSHYDSWITIGDDSLYFNQNETRAVFFRGNSLALQSRLFISSESSPVIVQGIIENPKVKHHYIITIDGYDYNGVVNPIDVHVDESVDETNLTFSNVHLSDGLMAYYPLNGTAADISGNQFHGTIMGADSGIDREGNHDGALHFDGVDDFITMGDVLDSVFVGHDQAFSFSFWMKPDTTHVKQIILAKSADSNCDADERQFHLKLTADHTLEFTTVFQPGYHHGHRVATTLNTLSDNDTWSHIVLTYDGSIDDEDGLARVKFFVNGSEETLQLTSVQRELASVSDGAAHLAMGNQVNSLGQNCGSHNYRGSLDEVRIYNRVLSNYEAAALMQQDTTP